MRRCVDRDSPGVLADGAIASTQIQVAVKKRAARLIILPTGHACANEAQPVDELEASDPRSSISWFRRYAR